jgi:hypothetical protein
MSVNNSALMGALDASGHLNRQAEKVVVPKRLFPGEVSDRTSFNVFPNGKMPSVETLKSIKRTDVAIFLSGKPLRTRCKLLANTRPFGEPWFQKTDNSEPITLSIPNFVGLGVTFQLLNDTVMKNAVQLRLPAALALFLGISAERGFAESDEAAAMCFPSLS